MALPIYGTNGADTLFGTILSDTIIARGGADTIVGSNGADSIDGGDGLDAADYSRGGIDRVSFSLLLDDEFDFSVQVAKRDVTSILGIIQLVDIGTDTLAGVERIIGGPIADEPGFRNSVSGETLGLPVGVLAGIVVDLGAGRLTFGGDFSGTPIDSSDGQFKLAKISVDIAGVDDATGTNNGDTITGGEGGNVISGLGGGDSLGGAGGADTVSGGDGADTLSGGSGADSLSGGEGSDWADYSGSAAPVNVELKRSVQSGGDAEGDVLIGIENVRGSSGSDVLGGDTLANVIIGEAGADSVVGFGGDDSLAGGAGDDTLIGGLGKDTLSGGDGADLFVFASAGATPVGSGRDVIADFVAGDAIDLTRIDAQSGVEGRQGFTFLGLGSADRVVGAGELKFYHFGGNTFVVGGIDADNQADFQIELTGTRTLTAAELLGVSSARLTGTPGVDQLLGTAGADTLSGGEGADTVTGGGSRDQLAGGTGADSFAFTAASDSTPTARDAIIDWQAGDRIDLSGFDADTTTDGVQDFTFKGVTTKYTTAAAGEVFVYIFGANTYVIAGVDGDAARDFQVEILGKHSLGAGDFVL